MMTFSRLESLHTRFVLTSLDGHNLQWPQVSRVRNSSGTRCACSCQQCMLKSAIGLLGLVMQESLQFQYDIHTVAASD